MSSKQLKLLLKEARDALNKKDFKTAIEKCRDALDYESTNYLALVFMGAAHQDRDKKKAAMYLRKALSCEKEPVVALQGLLNCAEVEELPKVLKELLKFVPGKYSEYHQKLVSISSSKDNLENCIEILGEETEVEGEEMNDRIESAWKCIARILIKQPEVPKKWEHLFENALKHAAADEKFEYHLECSKRYLKLLYKLNKFDDLLKQASILHKQYLQNVYPLEWICKVYTDHYNSNSVDFASCLIQSIDYYCNELLKLNKCSIQGLFVKGIQHYRNGEFVEARNTLLLQQIEATKFNNDLSSYGALLAETHMKLGAYSIAGHIWRNLKINDIRLAICLSHSKNKTDLKETIEILKNIPTGSEIEAYVTLIRAYSKLDETKEAQEFLEKLRDLNAEQSLLVEAEFLMPPDIAVEKLQNISSNDFDLNVVKGKKYLELKNYENSLTHILMATKQRPYYSECFMLLGQIYYAVKDLTRARKCFEKCINLNPQNELAVMSLSFIYRSAEEWELNSALLERTVKSFEGAKCTWAQFQLGMHYLSTKKFDQASHCFQAVVRVDPDNITYWETLADAYQQRGSYKSAMKVNQRILELDPDNFIAKLHLGQLNIKFRLFLEAIELFEEILRDHADFIPAFKGLADAHYGLALKLESKKLFKRCKSHLQQSINYLQKTFLAGKRNMVWLWRMLANIFTIVGCLATSQASLNVLGKLAGREEETINIQGKQLFDFAEKFYHCALKLRPDDHCLWREVSQFYYKFALHHGDDKTKLHQLKLAFNACKKTICLNASSWMSWNLMGVILATKEVNNLQLAQHCFIKALKIDRKTAVVWTNLGVLYLLANDVILANKAFGKAQQSNPLYSNAWTGQAIIAYKIGEGEESMDLFRHSTVLDFHTESAVGYARWVCSVLTDPKKSKNPDFKFAVEAMHAIPAALDLMTWYFNKMEENSSAEALSLLGFLNYRYQLWEPAIRAYHAVLKKATGQDKDRMLCNLGYAYLKNNQPVKAAEVFSTVTEATFKSVVGLALSYTKCDDIENAYSVYKSALDWMTNSEGEEASILLEMSPIIYAIKGEEETKMVLYQLLSLSEKPVESLYFACALGILHKDWELTDAVLDELNKYQDTLECCHHVAFLVSHYLAIKNERKRGLLYLLGRIHSFPDQPLLRKLFANYCVQYMSTSSKEMKSASRIAESVIPLGLIRSTTTLDAAKALAVASIAMGSIDKKKQKLLAQSSLHIYPKCEMAWNSLRVC